MTGNEGDFGPWAADDYTPATTTGLSPEIASLMGDWAAQQLAREAADDEDAIMARDRDLMRKDGIPDGAAEQLALQHARDRAVEADREAGQ